ESALEAARLRFRPIVMTSLAFILGCVPLVTTPGGAPPRPPPPRGAGGAPRCWVRIVRLCYLNQLETSSTR
ncbi:efflux RND transporter permease subunit, partial [Aeromonas enteropelogenes]